jgi:hypothetical protein
LSDVDGASPEGPNPEALKQEIALLIVELRFLGVPADSIERWRETSDSDQHFVYILLHEKMYVDIRRGVATATVEKLDPFGPDQYERDFPKPRTWP